MGILFALLALAAAQGLPQAKPGSRLHYRAENGQSFTLLFGSDGWVHLHSGRLQVWMQNAAAPVRYIVQEGEAAPREYRHGQTGGAMLPSIVSWSELLPRQSGGADVDYLGHRYQLQRAEESVAWTPPSGVRIVALRPEMMIGPASNARPKDDTRRWDQSDYEMARFTRDDYRQLAEAGINCVRVDDEQMPWADELGLYYWGAKLAGPEMQYRSQYLGPALYLDEPAVGTRDHVLRPRLAKDEAFRRSITPRIAFDAFRAHYAEVLAKRTHPVRQRNLYTWETMISTALHQLTQDPAVPEAFVFEPPGRIGTRRTLPEINMTYGTQFAADDARAFTALLFSFLRGAARLANKNWGISIYGAVDRADAPFWLTQAYDMGATRFHFWDNYQLACVPFREYAALARHLRNHAASRPPRDLDRLRRAAEVAITLPAGYDLGHVQMGRGSLWGVGELNLERRNAAGVPYRTVMSNFFLEAERCIRQGIAFDAMWDLAGHEPAGYRQVIRIRENTPPRAILPKEGTPPGLAVTLQRLPSGEYAAIARVTETTAPVHYTHGTDNEGVYRNAMVLWELFGPAEEDYRQIMPEGMRPAVRQSGRVAEVEIRFPVTRPGRYRLRAATVDVAGRRNVVWQSFTAN